MALWDYTKSRKKDIKKTISLIDGYRDHYKKIFDKYSDNVTKRKHKFEYIDSTTGKKYYEEVELTDLEFAFRRLTDLLRERIRNGSSLEEIKPLALALCCEAIKRAMWIKPEEKDFEVYQCQLEAAVAMFDDDIVEMKTGEGKSLVQILSAYLYSLEATSSLDKNKWKSVHILTSNDYLAKRDKDDNEKVFSLLGLSTGYAYPQSQIHKDKSLKEEKKKAYMCDIVYGTPSTVAFDHLDDHHAYKKEDVFLRKPLYKAIIDEADEVLLDQATTPLILGPSSDEENYADLYEWAYKFISGENGYRSKPVTCTVVEKEDSDYVYGFDRLDPKRKGCFYDSVIYKDSGLVHFKDSFNEEIYTTNLPATRTIAAKYSREDMYIAITQCLEAENLYKMGEQYTVVEEKSKNPNTKLFKIKLIDKSTGRIKENNTYEGGLQEAIEAKESYRLENLGLTSDGKKQSLKKSKSSKMLGKITYPAFVKLYENGFVGMTGTSDDEEFRNIYGKETYHVDPNKESRRVDEKDEIYVTKNAKYKAIITEIEKCVGNGGTLQPILVGTLNVNESDELCRLLDSRGIKYTRLDAVHNKDEAEVIANAGKLGSLTIATNMAGRGTNIKVNKEAQKAGGLYVISTSKNDNLRIDNQLRGRSGRQGALGRTKSYASLEDELVKESYGDNLLYAAEFLKLDKNKPIKNKKIIKQVNRAQRNKNGLAQAIRKQNNEKENKGFIKYKDFIYEQRDIILNATDEELKSIIKNNIIGYVEDVFKSKDELDIMLKLHQVIKIENCYVPGNINAFKNNVINQLSRCIDIISNKVPSYYDVIRKDILKIVDDRWIGYMNLLEDEWHMCAFKAYNGQEPMKEYERAAAFRFNDEWEKVKNELMTYAIFPQIEYGKFNADESRFKFMEDIENATQGKNVSNHMQKIINCMQFDELKKRVDHERALI